MTINIPSTKTKNTSIIVTLATLLVLSGAAAALSPTQAFADEGKDKSDPKHDDKKHDDKKHDDKKHDDKKSEDKKHDDKKSEDKKHDDKKSEDKKQHHTSDDKQNELLRAYIESVVAGTPQNELLRAYIESVVAGTAAEI